MTDDGGIGAVEMTSSSSPAVSSSPPPSAPPAPPDDALESPFEAEDMEDVPVESASSRTDGRIGGSRGAASSPPHPDEVKFDPDPALRERRRRNAVAAAAVLFVLCVALVVVLGFVGPDGTPPLTDTSDAGGGKGPKGGGGGYHSDRGEDVADFLLGRGASTSESLSDVGSAQHRAAVWMSAEDPLQLPVPPPAGDATDAADEFEQRYVLAALFYSLNGEGWTSSLNFLTGRDSCDWNEDFETKSGRNVALGVWCHPDTGRVSRIWTPWGNGLAGTLPDEVGRLGHLRSLSMQYGNITGTIPRSVGELSRLEELGLSNNMLRGAVPSSLKKLGSLRILALDDNALTGMVANTVSVLGQLRYCYLEDNTFVGDIAELRPESLTELIHLDLSTNSFTGTISPGLLNHPKLEVIDLHDNDLTGGFPSSITHHGTDDDDNDSDSDTPARPSLDFLALQENKLDGPIPAEIGNLRSLTYLDISRNRFAGQVATEIGQLTRLEYLFLGDNAFDPGHVPEFIRDLKSLRELSLKNSNRTGTIPDWIGELGYMYLLDLDGNDLTGAIPDSIGGLGDLFILMLNRNRLNGTVPGTFANLTQIELMLLDENDLTGSLSFLCPPPPTSPPDPSAPPHNIDWIAADCGVSVKNWGSPPEVECSYPDCCRICCDDDMTVCNDGGWFANNDPIWEHGYGRRKFDFEF